MLIGRRFIGLVLVLALWRSSVFAFAQSSPLDPATLLAQLDSPDFATREAASQTLLLSPAIAQETWAQLLSQARSPEQRHRLLAAARHHVLAGIRLDEFPSRGKGSLGMSQHVINEIQSQQMGRPGVLVNATFPGFPAFAYLRPGDLIIAINDVVMDAKTSNERFIELVQHNAAGQTVTLRFLRDGREHTARITLANFEALSSMYERGDPYPALASRYEMQWRQVRDKLIGPSDGAQPTQIPLLP